MKYVFLHYYFFDETKGRFWRGGEEGNSVPGFKNNRFSLMRRGLEEIGEIRFFTWSPFFPYLN